MFILKIMVYKNKSNSDFLCQIQLISIKRTVSNQGYVKFSLFRPRTVMYVENDELYTFTKIGLGASKKQFPLVYKTMRVMRINSSIEVEYIWTIAGSLSVQPFRWFPLVSSGFPWLSLVIPGYLMVVLSGRDCRRFLQMTGKIIANAHTISHIFESQITRYNQG